MVRPRAFFLLEPIRVGAGECFDQGGLAVVDVTGGGDDVHQVALGSERSAGDDLVVVGMDRAQIEHGRLAGGAVAMVDSGDDRVVEFAQRLGWSPSTATPTEGISTPGRVPPPGVDMTSTISPTP